MPVRHRALAALLGLLLVVGASAVLDVAAPRVAGASPVIDEDGFRNAFVSTQTQIDLGADIPCTLHPDSSAFSRLNSVPVVIDGHGHTIDAGGSGGTCAGSRALSYGGSSGLLTLRNVTITGGNVTGMCSVGGGGVQSNSDVVLDHVSIVGNTVTSSGTVVGTCATTAGGLSTASNSIVTLTASTIAMNSVTCALCNTAAGGLTAGTLNAVRSTISDNTTSSTTGSTGGGVAAKTISLVDSTVVANTAVTGANMEWTTAMTAYGSVVGLAVGGSSCSGGTITSNGNNWEEATSTCGFTNVAKHDHASAPDPQLGALGTNGGLTNTRLPAGGSPLINAIVADECDDDGAADVVTDQRDLVRPGTALGACDIGAVEVQQASGTSGTYTPLTPNRILDTRNGTGGLSGPFGPQQTRDLVVTGGATTVPGSHVEAVVLNVTATAPSAAGWLTLFPAGASLPTASNLNFSAGQTVPNLVVVKVGTGGKVSINNTGGNPAAGTVHVVADVVGYYTDPADTAVNGWFTPIAPNRILDTRTNVGLTGAFMPNQHRALTVTGGATTVPATASAVVMNVTATAPSAAGWLTVSPTGAAFPNASNLNFLAGQTVPNLVVVQVGTGHQVDIANTDVPTLPHPASGTVHVIADVVGYFDTTVSTLIPMAPQRILDTRTGTGNGGVIGPVAPNDAITVDPRTAVGLPPAGAYKGVIVNVTATGATLGGWLTCYPSDAALPNASNLNFVAGQTVPNLVQIGVGPDGTFTISNTDVPTLPHPASGTVHVIVDLVGWYQ